MATSGTSSRIGGVPPRPFPPRRRRPCRPRPRAACAARSGPAHDRRGGRPESSFAQYCHALVGIRCLGRVAQPACNPARHTDDWSPSILTARAALRQDRRSRQAAPIGAGDPHPRCRAEPSGGAPADHRGGPRPRRRPVRGARGPDRGRAGAGPVPDGRPDPRGGAGHRCPPHRAGRAGHPDRARTSRSAWPTSPRARRASGSLRTIPT